MQRNGFWHSKLAQGPTSHGLGTTNSTMPNLSRVFIINLLIDRNFTNYSIHVTLSFSQFKSLYWNRTKLIALSFAWISLLFDISTQKKLVIPQMKNWRIKNTVTKWRLPSERIKGKKRKQKKLCKVSLKSKDVVEHWRSGHRGLTSSSMNRPAAKEITATPKKRIRRWQANAMNSLFSR